MNKDEVKKQKQSYKLLKIVYGFWYLCWNLYLYLHPYRIIPSRQKYSMFIVFLLGYSLLLWNTRHLLMFPAFVTNRTKRWSWKNGLGVSQPAVNSAPFPLPFKSLNSTTCTLVPYKLLKASLILVEPQLIQSGPNRCNVRLLCPSSLPYTIK